MPNNNNNDVNGNSQAFCCHNNGNAVPNRSRTKLPMLASTVKKSSQSQKKMTQPDKKTKEDSCSTRMSRTPLNISTSPSVKMQCNPPVDTKMSADKSIKPRPTVGAAHNPAADRRVATTDAVVSRQNLSCYLVANCKNIVI